MKQIKRVLKLVLSSLIGFVIFLILMLALNYFNNNIDNNLVRIITIFLNSNFDLIVLMTILSFMGDGFEILRFPFNLPYPLIKAFASIFIISFMINILGLIEGAIGKEIIITWNIIKMIYIVIFAIVLLFGYLSIISRQEKEKKEKEEEEKKAKKEEEKKIGWKDVGGEFKLALYNLGRKLKRAFGGKDEA